MTRRGTYRGVYSSLFDDPDYQRLSAEARLVLLTLRLCAQAGAAAIFRAYVPVLAEQTGLKVDQIELALEELSRSPSLERPWILTEAGVVWVRNGLKWDPHVVMRDVRHQVHVARIVAALPRLSIVAKFCRYYKIRSPFRGPSNGHRSPIEGSSPPRPRPSTETETETDSAAQTPPSFDAQSKASKNGRRPSRRDATSRWIGHPGGELRPDGTVIPEP